MVYRPTTADEWADFHSRGECGGGVLVTPTAEGIKKIRRMQQARHDRVAEPLVEWPPGERIALARVRTLLNGGIIRKRLKST